MKKAYIVEITDEALFNMKRLYQHIVKVLPPPDNAIGQYNRMADAILTLDELPKRCPVMNSELEHSRKIRRMLIDYYSECYVIEEERVVIIRVLYSASDIEHRLRY